MRVIFMGTPDFSASILETLLRDKEIEVVGVYTQPPRPKGRGHKVQLSPVHELAHSHEVPVFTPTSLKSIEEQEFFSSLKADVTVVAAYGLLLPKAILEAPLKGCVNVHASLLPRWRGAAPIQRAILSGDLLTGITFMKMDEGLDTGDMISKHEVTISPEETSSTLHDELRICACEHLISTLKAYMAGKLRAIPQPDEGVTYASKLQKAESQAGFEREEAIDLLRKIRGLSPWPGVWVTFKNEPLKILQAKIHPLQATPGEIIQNTPLIVACLKDALELVLVQKENSKPMTAAAFLNGLSGTKTKKIDVKRSCLS